MKKVVGEEEARGQVRSHRQGSRALDEEDAFICCVFRSHLIIGSKANLNFYKITLRANSFNPPDIKKIYIYLHFIYEETEAQIC